jgi:hypothetical protein
LNGTAVPEPASTVVIIIGLDTSAIPCRELNSAT